MPAICTCPICGFNGNHGFSLSDRLSGTTFYHSEGTNFHRWYDGIDNKVYTDRLEAFKGGAKFLNESLNTNWHQAMIARITGHSRKANKLFKLWHQEEGY